MHISPEILAAKYGFENPFKPAPLALKAMPYLKAGDQMLDIGCGEGADAVFFANHGCSVNAIDANEIYLKRFQDFANDYQISDVSVHCSDVISYRYQQNFYDAVNCLLVGCCMKRSEFEKMLPHIKQAVKHGGIIIMSLRNYLDPELKDYTGIEKMIEPNTYFKKDDCCKIRYFIEKNRLREIFHDFEILYYYEGLVPDKYGEIPEHGDSHIICRRRIEN